jgi:hypothetical protein
VIIDNQNVRSNCFTAYSPDYWNSVSLIDRNKVGSLVAKQQQNDWPHIYLRNVSVKQSFLLTESGALEQCKYFGVRVYNPGIVFHLNDCVVSDAVLSGVLIDRGATGIIEGCLVQKNGQNGVFLYVSCWGFT